MAEGRRFSRADVRGHADALLDTSLADTFPASDPVALVLPHKHADVVLSEARAMQHIDLEPQGNPASIWASDVRPVESFPTSRLPGTPFPVTFSSVVDSRRRLDGICGPGPDDPIPPPRRDIPRRRRQLGNKEAA